MRVPFTMRPTGWFQIGWSAEIPRGAVKPLKYLGHDLVAFRSEQGMLAVLDAHCAHLGAHLGYGGKVLGECVACPYHGWQWSAEGINTLIPYQDKPINKRLKAWHVKEQHEIIFLWHDPAGGAPRWDLPDVFDCFPGISGEIDDYYAAYPHGVTTAANEPIHPQLTMENAGDSMHFRYTHSSPMNPELLGFEEGETTWRGHIGFKSVKTKQIAMTLHTLHVGVGLVFGTFDGSRHYRFVLAATPVDDETSDIRVSYWFQRDALNRTGDMPLTVRQIARQTLDVLEEDLMIWRHQDYVEKPVFAAQDVAAYSSIRKYCKKFYEDDPPRPVARAIA